MRLIIERKTEIGEELCTAFIHIEKTFDYVTWGVLFPKLEEILDYRDRNIKNKRLRQELESQKKKYQEK